MSQTSAQKGTGGSGVLVWVLIVAACVAVVLATLAIGVEQVLLNTDRWVGAVGPLASDPDVQSSLAEAAATQATTAIDTQLQSLPGPLQRLAAPTESGRNSFVHDQAHNLVQSPQFAQLWIDVNRAGHSALVQLLRGGATGSGALAVSNGDLQLNLLALMPELVQRVQQLPANLLPSAPPTDFGYVNLTSANALATAQQVVQLLDRTTWVLVVAAIVLILIALGVSSDRRVTALRLGVGVAIGTLALGLGLIVAQGRIVSSIADRPISGALQAALSAVLVSLGQFISLVFLAGAIVAVVAFVDWPEYQARGKCMTLSEWDHAAMPHGSPASPIRCAYGR